MQVENAESDITWKADKGCSYDTHLAKQLTSSNKQGSSHPDFEP